MMALRAVQVRLLRVPTAVGQGRRLPHLGTHHHQFGRSGLVLTADDEGDDDELNVAWPCERCVAPVW
jgi:hypothetical protein